MKRLRAAVVAASAVVGVAMTGAPAHADTPWKVVGQVNVPGCAAYLYGHWLSDGSAEVQGEAIGVGTQYGIKCGIRVQRERAGSYGWTDVSNPIYSTTPDDTPAWSGIHWDGSDNSVQSRVCLWQYNSAFGSGGFVGCSGGW
ncbi:hypothetical protein ABZ746_34215 [Streptomyces sp. NPDC020096]